MVGFREMCGQNLVKVGQTQSNLIDGPNTTKVGEIHIQILIIRIEEYGDILVLVKFEGNKKLIGMSTINCLNSSFCSLK